MKVKSLKMTNFRGIKELELEFHDQTNILVGVNGSGKSSILDCLAILLSRLHYQIRPTKGTGRLFTEKDISNNSDITLNRICIYHNELTYDWFYNKTKRGILKIRRGILRITPSKVKELADCILSDLNNGNNTNLPLAIYYPVNRAVLQIPLRVRGKPAFDQLSAYDQALTAKSNEFKTFFGWFRNREDIENEKRVRSRRGSSFRDPQLLAVRDAIESILPGFSELHVRRSPLRMIVMKGKEELVIDQLSDGEKCLLAMVGDLARRLAIANPGLKKPLEGNAVVMIDEIDLHLHPEWQRMIVPALEQTFPNCQFFLTTHSPQILSHVRAEKIFVLHRTGENTQVVQPDESYGHDSNRLLEDIMGVPERPNEVKEELEKLFQSIDQGKLDRAKRVLKGLEEDIGTDPALVKANVLIHRSEILNR